MQRHLMKNQLAMTSNEILKADVLDIVFDNRNKNYGAYLLRKYYNNRLGIALGGMLGFVLIIVLIISLNSDVRMAISNAIDTTDTVKLSPVPYLPAKPLPPAIHPPQPNVRQINDSRFEIADAPTTVPTQDDISKAVISNINESGSDFDGIQPRITESGNSNEPTAQGASPSPPSPLPTSAASFPGGQQAWMNFLNKYLRTPDELEAGQKRTVLVRFAVGEDGSITKFEIVQSGGAAFDNEVIRVLKKMPKWKPAVQNGQNVSVMFTQPVTFVAYEE